MPALPDFTPLEDVEEVIVAGDYQVVFYSRAGLAPRFRHVCDRSDSRRGTIICAPLLVNHTIAEREPLTITPSILCQDCKTHGFITNGQWVPAG